MNQLECDILLDMQVHTDIPLKNYLTMRIGGNARFMTDVTNEDELATACRNSINQNIPFFILGGGSNVVAKDEGFSGIVIRNRIMGFEKIGEDDTSVTIKIGAGENWDEVVAKSVEMGLSGIEAMSAIPGTAGAAPVQNVGAYGQEIADTLLSLIAYDSQTDRLVSLESSDCGFSYRNSIFRSTEQGRYAITSITLKLYKSPPQPPFYDALQKYFDANDISLVSPKIIRDAVTTIRREKLPNPALKPNSGSFFKNAVIEEWQLSELKKTWPDIPSYDLGDKKVKVPTGWLIEKCGQKGTLLHGFRVHDKNALVLINESATGYIDLQMAVNEIKGAVRDTFRIDIFQEPLEI